MNRQQPATINQISNSKPNVPKSEVMITGNVANSLNGGMYKAINYQKVMAGQRVKQYNLQGKFQMLTPVTPAFQRLRATVLSVFVPNSRVWNNAEKFTAQNGGASETKILEIPNVGGKQIPTVQIGEPSNNIPNYTNLSNTTEWRDSYVSTYLPRMGINRTTSGANLNIENGRDQYVLPPINVLPLRGFKAIYNDILRNKEYEEEWQEYKGDEVTTAEFNSYLPTENNLKNCIVRARRNNSYYTDYRTELQGFESEFPTEYNATKDLTDWLAWENLVTEARSQAEDAQANAWDIIAKIRGSKKLTEGKVQIIGKATFDLNYSAITQTSYNNNENISEEFRAMGKQGAYSYTEINLPCYAGMIFNEEGFVHQIMFVTADTVFESGIDRHLLNVRWEDEYRPDLLEQKDDVLYTIEMSTALGNNTTNFGEIVGYKRKYNENFKLSNVIRGDMSTLDWWDKVDEEYPNVPNVITQKSFQFYELGYNIEYLNGGPLNGETMVGVAAYTKKIWKDYTDMQINANQAVTNIVHDIEDEDTIRVGGQNQIFFAGITFCATELPIDNSIIGNSTTWGEH